MIPKCEESDLNQAEVSTFAPKQFHCYVKEAKLMCRSGAVEDADKIYKMASQVLEKIPYEAGHVIRLLTLSELSLELNPKKIPEELHEAEEWIAKKCAQAEEHPRQMHILAGEYAIAFAKLAENYFRLKIAAIGDKYLMQAQALASNQENTFFERVNFRHSIAKAYVFKVIEQPGGGDIVGFLKTTSFKDPYIKYHAYLVASKLPALNEDEREYFIKAASQELINLGKIIDAIQL